MVNEYAVNNLSVLLTLRHKGSIYVYPLIEGYTTSERNAKFGADANCFTLDLGSETNWKNPIGTHVGTEQIFFPLE